MPVMKIDLHKIRQQLVSDVQRIEKSDWPQAKKTTAFKQAATKVLNALYLDKRRYGGKKVENRISLATFSSYLTRLRKSLEELNLHHHLLEREVQRLQKRYPLHAPLFEPMLAEGATVADLRKAKGAIKDALKDEAALARGFSAINFSGAYKSALIMLAKAHPAWAGRLQAINENGRPNLELVAELRASFDEVEAALNDVIGIKIDHEVVVNLKLPPGMKEQFLEAADKRLDTKQNNNTLIDYPTYMHKLGLLLTQPWATYKEHTAWDFELTVFALCGATGRRPIEIISLGEFERIDEYRLRFKGQAKKRDDERDDGYMIYSLFPADLVIKAFNGLRMLDRTKELNALTPPGDMRSQEKMINDRVANGLNKLARRVFYGVGKAQRLYDTRAIYARICRERWFDHDPRWAKVNEDAFYSQLLGHDDPNAQLQYKHIKLQRFHHNRPPIEAMESRYEQLCKLDDAVKGISRGDAAAVLHEWVKEQVLADPSVVINQTVIIRERKCYAPMVKRYLEITGQALMIKEGTYGIDLSFLDEPVAVAEVMDILDMGPEQLAERQAKRDAELEAPEDEQEPDPEGDEAEQEPEPDPDGGEPEPEPEQATDQGHYHQPKFRCKGQAGSWLVTLCIGSLRIRFNSDADGLHEACQDAWGQWLASWSKVAISARRVDGWWSVSATLPDGTVLANEVMGSKADAIAPVKADVARAFAHYESLEG